jgi:hypothetical protein
MIASKGSRAVTMLIRGYCARASKDRRLRSFLRIRKHFCHLSGKRSTIPAFSRPEISRVLFEQSLIGMLLSNIHSLDWSWIRGFRETSTTQLGSRSACRSRSPSATLNLALSPSCPLRIASVLNRLMALSIFLTVFTRLSCLAPFSLAG